jgi:hypothetical protein
MGRASLCSHEPGGRNTLLKGGRWLELTCSEYPFRGVDLKVMRIPDLFCLWAEHLPKGGQVARICDCNLVMGLPINTKWAEKISTHFQFVGGTGLEPATSAV